MNEFINSTKDIGTVKVGQTVVVYFEYNQLGNIIKLESPCDCSTPTHDPDNKRIKVRYTAKPISPQIKAMGKTQQVIRKVINVSHSSLEDGTLQLTQLSFTGIVTE